MSKKYHRKYDPLKHRGHRKGVEPAGLKRWRLAHRRTHDPQRRAKATYIGERGGKYFRGPKTRRYDPNPSRLQKFRGYRKRVSGFGGTDYTRGTLGKIERGLEKWGMAIGMALGFGVPTWDAWNKYSKIDPSMTMGRFFGWEEHPADKAWMSSAKSEFMTLIGQNPRPGAKQGFDSIPEYLKVKFLKSGEAWVIPFWASLATYIVSKLGILPKRINRIVTPISKGALISTTIGALTMPGCEAPKNVISTVPQTIGGRTVYAPQNEYVYGK